MTYADIIVLLNKHTISTALTDTGVYFSNGEISLSETGLGCQYIAIHWGGDTFFIIESFRAAW